MYVIRKDFAFSASHQLDGLPPEHQCARLHGHNYVVTVELSARALDDTGFVLDYGLLGSFKRWLDGALDHRHLNDVLTFNPTAELLAQYLADRVAMTLGVPCGAPPDSNAPGSLLGGGALVPYVSGVCVSETPKTTAWYRP